MKKEQFKNESRRVVIADEQDNLIKEETRDKCHEGKSSLHRVVTIFIFNDKGEVLITKRSKQKQLWPGFWGSSCLTHVYENESYEKAGERRLPQELGFSCKLKFLFKFHYQAKYKDIGSENEMCALLVGKYNGKVKPNKQEVADYKWISLDELKKDIKKNPSKYAPWLKIALEKIGSSYKRENTNREDYIKDMKFIGAKSLAYLGEFLKEKLKNEELFEALTLFLKKRIIAIVRPWFVKNSFSYFCNCENKINIEKYLPVAAVSELHNLSIYQANTVYDNKYGIAEKEREKNIQIIVSFVTRDLVDDLLYKAYPSQIALPLSLIFQKTDYYTQRGQFLEFTKLFFSDGYNFSDLRGYILTYLRKIAYYGQELEALILSGAVVARENMNTLINNEDLKHLIKYGILTGAAWNIVNDISDYALFDNEGEEYRMHYKRPEDQFKDIENKRILLPFYYTIYQAKRKSKKDFEKLKNCIGRKLSIEEKKEIFNLMKKYNGLSFAYTVAKLINNRALKELDKVREKRKEIELFKISSSIIENNKFLHYYRSKNAIKRITINPEIKNLIKSQFLSNAGVATGMASDFLRSLRDL